MTEQSDTLRGAIAAGVQKLRKDSGWSQDELAVQMRDIGFPTWTRNVVAALERNRREIQIEEAVALTIVLGVRLADLLPQNPPFEVVRLGEQIGFPLAEIERIFRGRLPGEGPTGDLDREYRLASAASGLLETRLAARLSRSPDEIVEASMELWGRSATEERDARAGDRPNTRQHVSRELRANLVAFFDRANRRPRPAENPRNHG